MAENFYFAWINEADAFNPAVHNREDEDVFSFTMTQIEGDFAALDIIVKNPRIGLLNPGRKVWCWFSMNIGTDTAPVLKPLFKGRLIGIPDNVFDTLVTLKFTARPSNFVARKAALAATMRNLPWWDPIFIAPASWVDDDTVLEARSALWHIDPVTHALTTSDVLVPEDGTIEFPESVVLYDAVAVTLQTVPLRAVDVTATIPWTQTATGTVDLTSTILHRFPGTGGIGGLISSFTFNGLSGSWPKDGATIGDGWVVTTGHLDDLSFLAVPHISLPNFYDPASIPQAIPEGSIIYQASVTGRVWSGTTGAGFDETIQQVIVPIGYGVPTLVVSYGAKRDLAEVVHFKLVTDMQPLVTLADGTEALAIAISANKVSDLTYGNYIPIGDVRSRNFATSPRGQLAVEHLILLARANLVIRARAVKVTFQCALLDGINATLRKGALVHDHRLPGQQAGGKIVSYQFQLDGSNGTPLATIVMASSIGYGGAYTESPGSPSWVDASWVAPEWQEYTDVVKLTGTSDITFAMPRTAYFDDGVDFIRGLTPANSVLQLTVTNGPIDQKAALGGDHPGFGDQAAVSAALQLMPTTISLKLVGLGGGPYTGSVEIGVSHLIVPKQIDLEAPSV
jgi:hypothetical protein